MLTLQSDTLHFAFPEVHQKARCGVKFSRTLRVPDDQRPYLVPPTLTPIAPNQVDDYPEHLPKDWRRRGGVFLPLYQAEALSLSFTGDYPFALKIGAGKINTLTGEPWQHELNPERQDYLVSTQNRFLDGFHVAANRVRQFVAMPLGEGYTAEEQLTGLAHHGGLQILAYPLKAEVFRTRFGAWADSDDEYRSMDINFCRSGQARTQNAEMGLAPGGLVAQPTDRDPYGYDAWDQTQRARCFVHLLNSRQYHAVTGVKLPYPPPGVCDYKRHRLPWYHHYSEGEPVESSGILAKLASVATWFKAKHGQPLPDNAPPGPVAIRPIQARSVRSG